MKKNLRWKVILVLAVIALAAFLAYPPGEKIQLGLDLSGGIHLVLQVMTDDAIDNETDQSILRLQEQLEKKDIQYEAISKDENRVGRFTVQQYDSQKDAEFRDLISEYFGGDWDISYSRNNVTIVMKQNVMLHLRNQAVRQSEETIWNRVDEFGLTEPTIQTQGGFTGDRIIVELPGIENPERIKNIIKKTAQLEWKLVRANPANDLETLLADFGGEVPSDMEVLEGDPERAEYRYYLVSRVAEVSGKDLRMARRSTDEWNNPAVLFQLSPDGSRRFHKTTQDNVGEPLAIVLDDKVQSAPIIEDVIPTGSGIIRGRYTIDQADDLALVLRAGALPASIKYLEQRTIGPSLGIDSIRKGFAAIVVALLLVLAFMAFYYRLAGLNAITALILNILILMGALAYFKASLTLPGIAGIILTIGMAVDANVLVFERIREELAQGKSVLSSIAAGFSRALRTILDANVTTIIAAVFLFQFGTGPLRGFAITLIIGISASMFTALFVSRLIFDIFLAKRKKREKLSI
ncbi:MAG: protein translocase subunit SecD [Candidatus Aminicenantes bacterium]|jgi:preprotein translocase subunit SecD